MSVLVLAVAVLIVAAALLTVDTEKVRAKSTCPSGTKKLAHVCIETGIRDPASHSNASATCAALGRRLPAAELDSIANSQASKLATYRMTLAKTSGRAISSVPPRWQ
jgi:UL45 protein, carbohydrate-binding C-type lectin-like